QADAPPLVARDRVAAGHLLQEQPAAAGAVAEQGKAAGHLRGARVVVLDARGERGAAHLDDALVRPFHAARIDGDRAARVGHPLAERHAVVRAPAGPRRAALLAVAGALPDQPPERLVAAELQRDRALEFQALGDERAGGGGMPERLHHRAAVGTTLEHALPGGLEL